MAGLSRAGRTGALLINLGTPDAPQTREVRRYLRQFLSDPRVIDLPGPARWALLNLVILPSRPRKSAEAYRKVWGEQGSPLLSIGRQLLRGVAEQLSGIPVELAMRYGQPSIEAGLESLWSQGCQRVVALPLYPQYASSSTASTVAELYRVAATRLDPQSLHVLEPFFAEPSFIEAWGEVAGPILSEFEPDHVLFSYHGLPERQLKKSDPSGQNCLIAEGCCDQLTALNARCYRAHCLATSRALIQRLDLTEDNTSTSFQSRLGRTPWLRPFTDHVLPELAQSGIEKLAVMCPSFVADCLETLEEIGIRGKDMFVAAGGKDLRLVPSLNATPPWVDAVAGYIKQALPKDAEIV